MLMFKNHILDIMIIHQSYPIWIIKSAKNNTFSFWPCQELSIKTLKGSRTQTNFLPPLSIPSPIPPPPIHPSSWPPCLSHLTILPSHLLHKNLALLFPACLLQLDGRLTDFDAGHFKCDSNFGGELIFRLHCLINFFPIPCPRHPSGSYRVHQLQHNLTICYL